MTQARQSTAAELGATQAYLRAAAAARRRRLVAARASTGLLLVSAAVTTSLVLLGVAPALRDWVALGLFSVVAVAIAAAVAPLLLRDSPATTAAWIGRREPSLGGAAHDALEFGDRLLGRGSPLRTGSDALAAAHVSQVAERLHGDDPARHARAAVPALGFPRACVVAAGALVAALVMPGSRDLLLFSEVVPMTVDAAAHGEVELTYAYPAYLRLEPRTERGLGDVQAPVGTHVTVRVRADRPLRWARLASLAAGSSEMTVEQNDAVGQLVVVRDDAYRIVLRGVSGGVDEESPLHAIRAVPDELPRVRLVSPGADVSLGADASLSVEYRVGDDHGVAEVVLLLEPADVEEGVEDPGSSAHARPLQTFTPPVLSRTDLRSLSAADLGLSPGQSAWLSVAARDDDEVSGPKWARSRRVLVSVGSEADAREELDEGEQVVAEKLLALLGSHLVAEPERVKDDPALRTSFRTFNAALEDVVDRMPALLDRLDSGPDADLAAWSALEAMRARLDGMLRDRVEQVAPLASTGQPARLRSALARLHPREIGELESDVLVFDMWSDRRTVVRALDAGSSLMEQAERIQELLGREGEKLTGAEQELLDEAFEALGASLEGFAEAMASAGSSGAPDAAAASARMRRAVEEMKAALARGDMEAARRAAHQVASQAQSLAQEASSLADAGGMGDPDLDREVGELRQELRALRAQQSDLRDRTNQLRDDTQRSLSAEDRQKTEDMFRRLTALAEAAIADEGRGEESLGRAPAMARYFERLQQRSSIEERILALRDGGELRESQVEELRELAEKHRDLVLSDLGGESGVDSLMRAAQASREQLGRLLQSLVDRDAAAARRPARGAAANLEFLLADMAQKPELREHAPPFEAAERKANEILDALQELEDQMRRAAERGLSEERRQELMSLGMEQAELRRGAREAAARLRELGADAPFLDERAAESAGRAGSRMEEAEQELFGTRPGQASESQGEAMADLDEALKGLSPQPGGSQGSGRRPGRMGKASREEVEIPDEEAYRVPREFREEILEAMRESSPPQGYEQQVREYYRRLVE